MKFERLLFNLLEIVPFVPVKTFLRNKNNNAVHLVPCKTFSRNKTVEISQFVQLKTFIRNQKLPDVLIHNLRDSQSIHGNSLHV